MLTSTLGVLFVISAAVQVWLMLEVIGREKPRFNEKIMSLIHRWNGRVFVLIYFVLAYVMIQRIAQSNAPLETRTIIHAVLALAILPILFVKILIVRRYPRAFNYVLPMGVAILAISVAFVGVMGGYYFIKKATGTYVSTFNPHAGYLDVEVGRAIVIQKCNKCHDLTRVFTIVKTPEDWLGTVNRMAERDPTWLSADQIQQAVHFLSERQNIRKAEQVSPVQAEAILLTKCSKCHNLDRAFNKRRTEHEWKILVKRMSTRHRSWINDDEAEFLGRYMAKVYGVKENGKTEPVAAGPQQTARTTAAVAAKPAAAAPVQAIDFRPLFQANGCVFCHGEKGDGVAPGTPDWTDPEWQDSRTDEQLTQTIIDGKDTRMPKFGGTLSEAEIHAAVKFVRKFRQD
jgi:mono/diheme cytochrome c family protein